MSNETPLSTNESSIESKGEDNLLDQKFWDDRYLNNTTGWDLNEVSPPLKQYMDQCNNKALKILIPGAGNAHEANYLLQQGFTDITIIDIAPTVVARLKKQFQQNIHIQIMLGDFFKLEGKYDLILEQTFFCALTPLLREQYVAKMYDILNDNGKLVGLLFDKEFEGGPPFGGTKAVYKKLFQGLFIYKTFESCYNSVAPRMGYELFIIFIKNFNSSLKLNKVNYVKIAY